MSGAFKLEFAPLAAPVKGVLVLFCEDGLKFGSAARRAVDPTGDLVTRAAAADRFKGKNGSALDIVAPAGLDVSRLLVVGVGKARELKAQDFVKLGGAAMGKIPAAASEATIMVDLPGGGIKPDRIADLALGVVEGKLLDRLGPPPDSSSQRVVKVTEAVTVGDGRFRFADEFHGLEVIPQAGTVIAYDGARPIRTPYDDCVLIMPSRRLAPGLTAVRLGRFVG